MAPMSYFLVTLISVWTLLLGVNGQLSTTFYATSCPNLESIVRSGMQAAVNAETRMAASILRMHFHDCFVLGCDASVLLDDTATFTGEKTAGPNVNSLRGFEVIDTIKSQVEASCSGVVSCADILTLAARDAVVLVGGRSWPVVLGRRDRRTASLALANSDLPGPGSSLSTLIARFQAKGLTAAEMTALSGAHTIGAARCLTFRSHIYNDTNIDPSFAALRRQNCPFSGGDGNLAQLDVRTPVQFDNQYYVNLVARQGLFHSDQELFGTGSSQNARVTAYGLSNSLFLSDFANAMIKMGNIGVLTGTNGEIRTNCRAVN